MRLNFSAFGKSLIAASTATLALVLLSNLSVDYIQAAMAQATADDTTVEATDGDGKFGRHRHLKRARRAYDNSAAATSEGDPGNSAIPANPNFASGPGAAPSGRFVRSGGRREFAGGGMKMRLLKERAGLGAGMGSGISRGPLDLSQLNLTDEQKTRITDQRGKSKGQAKELQGTIKAKRLEMRDMMFDPAFSPEQIRAKRQELRKVQDQAELLMLNDFLSMRSVLTPDQLKKLRPNVAARGRGIANAAAAPVTSSSPSTPEAAPDATSSVTSSFATVNSGSAKKGK